MKRLIHLMCVISLIHVSAVAAQTDTLSPIVITATRTPMPIGSLSNGVTVLEGDALRRAGVATVIEALRAVPSLHLAQAGSWGAQTSMFLRGGESDYVRVLLDGVPLNQSGGAIDLANLTTANVERIEIVRGPTSVLYGSDAVAGVIQIITRRGAGTRLMAQARGGERGSSNLQAEVSAGTARLGLSAGLQRDATDGIERLNNQHDKTTASARVAAMPDARTDLALTARFRDGAFHYPTGGGGGTGDSNSFGDSRQLTIALEAGRRLSRTLEVRALLSAAESRDSSDDAPDSPGDTTAMGYASESRRNTSRHGLDLRAGIQAVPALHLTAGVALENQKGGNRGSFSSGPPFGVSVTPLSTVHRVNRAAYLQALTTRGVLSLQAGARVDDNQRFGSFGTWKLGATAAITPATRLRAGAGTAFKEPTFDQNFNTAFSVGNPDLRPERSTSFEAGIEQAIGGLSVAATVFDQRFRDMIQYAFAGGTAPDYNNVAGARASGIETEIRMAPVPGLRLALQHTWLRTEVTDSAVADPSFVEGARLIRRPKHSASLSAEWLAGAATAAGLRVTHVGRRDDLDFSAFPAARIELPDFTRLDVWASARIARLNGGRAALSLTARVENALDARYAEIAGFPAPGRRAMAGLRVDAGGMNR